MNKKKIILAIVMAAMTLGAFAQWQPSDKDYIRLDKEGTYGQMLPKALRTADGKTVLTWLRQPDLDLNDPAMGFYLHMQIFDAEGKALFGDEGILVSDKPTASYTTDYGLCLAPNGDILIAFPDTRNDPTRAKWEVYVYRYDLQGQLVWSADGVKVNAKVVHVEGSEASPSLCVSGDQIYLSLEHMETWQEKANENNWQPDPDFPDEPMPEYVTLGYTDYQVMRLNDDGSAAWADNFQQECIMMVMAAAPEGSVYLIYNNDTFGLEAQRLDKDGQRVWASPVTVESQPLTPGNYMPTPLCAVDEEGGVALAYRIITDWGGYEAYNRLSPDGKAFETGVPANGSTEGDAGADEIATRGQLAFVAWKLEMGGLMMYANLFKLDGNYAWEGPKSEGIAIDAFSEWDFRPVKVIPQADGWVLLYGNATDWDTAKFIACKINDDGATVWSKQLAEGDFRSSGFAIANDDTYAYIFFTREEEYDESGTIIPGSGGLFVMCVDISDAGNPSAIQKVSVQNEVQSPRYNLHGQRVNDSYKGLVIQNGKKCITK